jgi:hypothetical protein
VPQQIKDLIVQCWAQNPNDRPLFSDLVRQEHWLHNILKENDTKTATDSLQKEIENRKGLSGTSEKQPRQSNLKPKDQTMGSIDDDKGEQADIAYFALDLNLGQNICQK